MMPCVLPVLGLKFLVFSQTKSWSVQKIRQNFLATAGGIYLSFLVLAGGVVILKSMGGRAGLGMHFQNPYFLSLMVVMLSLFTANLWVFFEVTLPLKITWAVNIVLNRQHGGRAPSLLEGEKVMALCCVRGCWRFC